jgi:plastocyanin
MITRNYLLAAIAVLLLASQPALSGEFVVGQKDKAFTTETLQVKVGDTVNFVNSDPFFHNIFSLTQDTSFDLGYFTKGQSRSYTFTKPGKVEIECAIHPEMVMQIEVAP